MGFKVTLLQTQKEALKRLGIVGYFVVRQKRHPITLCQGISIPVSLDCGIPLIPRVCGNDLREYCLQQNDYIESTKCYGITQSFITQEFKIGSVGYPAYALALPTQNNMYPEKDFREMCKQPKRFLNQHILVDLSHRNNDQWSDVKMRGIVSADPILQSEIRNKINGQFSLSGIKLLNHGFRFNGYFNNSYACLYDINEDSLIN